MKDQTQLAAEILGLTASQLFPSLKRLGGVGTEHLFFYDFHFSSPLETSELPLLEERMRLFIKKAPPIRAFEMMPVNAASMLLHKGEGVFAQKVQGVEGGLIQLLEIDSVICLCKEDVALEWERENVFKLLEIYTYESAEGSVVRVIGALFQEKNALKNFSKENRGFAARYHLSVNQKKNLFLPLEEGWGFLPEGEKRKQYLLASWRTLASQYGFSEVTTPALEGEYTTSHLKCLEKIKGQKKIGQIGYAYGKAQGEGFLEPGPYLTDHLHLLSSQKNLKEDCFSCLQFILEIPRMLGFKCEVVVHVKRQKRGREVGALVEAFLKERDLTYSVEKNPTFGHDASIVLRIEDSLGRYWDGPWMGVSAHKKLPADSILLEASALGSVERLIALGLELGIDLL